VQNHKTNQEALKMETLGTALLTDEIPASRAVTTIVPRVQIAEALQDPQASPELFLDLDRGDERATIGISWSHDELEKLLERASGDDILFTFDRDQLELAFADVEAHGLRQTAAIFAVAAAGALGSGAAIANASIPIEQGSGSAATVAAVQSMAANSMGGVASNVHTPGIQMGAGESEAAAPSAQVSVKATDGGLASNVHTPGLQTGDEGATVTPSAEVSAARTADTGLASNVHTPGLKVGPGEAAAAAPSAQVSVKAADSAVASNVHTPGLQIGPGEATTGVRPAVQVSTPSASSSGSEFLGIDTRDVTDGLIAGGVLLAIAGATFAGARRTGSARPA
jgi:hypothetical protein